MKIKATVEFEISTEDTRDDGTFVAESLLGELVTVKSGRYENLLMGHIVYVDMSESRD